MIRDSLLDGISILAPGSKKGASTLSNGWLENVSIIHSGTAVASRHDQWIREDFVSGVTLVNTEIADIKNDFSPFTTQRE